MGPEHLKASWNQIVDLGQSFADYNKLMRRLNSWYVQHIISQVLERKEPLAKNSAFRFEYVILGF